MKFYYLACHLMSYFIIDGIGFKQNSWLGNFFCFLHQATFRPKDKTFRKQDYSSVVGTLKKVGKDKDKIKRW